MLFKIANWLTQRVTNASAGTQQPQLVLSNFLDFDLDLVGLYAHGHHSFEVFLAEVRRYSPYVSFDKNRVKHIWAVFNDRGFAECDRFARDAKPITVLELND